ncbi:MAG: hypothetical protein IPK11_15820 [Ignavibacteria bacterium]|nr:hypothetical protein [Ignavibacteria bacterium]
MHSLIAQSVLRGFRVVRGWRVGALFNRFATKKSVRAIIMKWNIHDDL